MELTVVKNGEKVGVCTAEEMGLYWNLSCRCQIVSDRVERLYCGERRLGVLEREGEALTLHRCISRSSVPDFPPRDGCLSLSPLWQGQILDCPLPPGHLEAGKVWYPAVEDGEFPCMPLFCFFSLERQGNLLYWTIYRDGLDGAKSGDTDFAQ